MKNPARAWLIVSLDCICTDMQSHMTRRATNPQENILEILPAVSVAVPKSMYLCWSNHLSCSVSPGDHKWIDVPVLFSTPSRQQVFQIAPSLAQRREIPPSCRDDKSISLSPVPPHVTVRMIYEFSWRLNKRPKPAPTGRQTQRREGESAREGWVGAGH